MTERNAALPGDLVEDVLEFLDYPGVPDTTAAGLTSIYRAWCRAVPFDNVRKLIAIRSGAAGRLPGDDPLDFFNALLDDAVGGTCWAGNGALCALLQSLGFDAVRAVGTMVVAPNIPPNHGSVVVRIGRDRFVTDASIMSVVPVRVAPGESITIDHPAWGVTGHWLDGAFAIRWRPINRDDAIDCRIDTFAVDAARFRAQHEATRRWSPFNTELMLNLVTEDGRIGIARGRKIVIDRNGRVSQEEIIDRVGFLVDELGISERIAARIPEDLPTPPPPGSRTAAALNS
jgi:N-hydroxyarylamine O-acetyltransferase